MKIGILCACERELNPYLADMCEVNVEQVAMRTFYKGKLESVEVVAVFSGCGKMNAAMTTQILIDKFQVDAILFSGIAGGLKGETKVFDTVICTSAEFHDTDKEIYSDFPIMEEPVFYADKELVKLAEKVVKQVDWNIHFGRATTGDRFTKDISKEALCIDMETAAAAHVCYMNQVPFLSVRNISDNNTEHGQEVINRNFDKAAYRSWVVVREMLAEL